MNEPVNAPLKALAKSALRGTAAIFGPHRWRRGPCLLVLTYHRVLPEGHPDRASEQPGMLVSPELLKMHLEVLAEHFTFVHLDDWLRAAAAGSPPPGRSLALTFDDGWRDTCDHAFPVLEQAGAPATVFLVTDMVGTSYSFWPNRLARLLAGWQPAQAQRLDERTRGRMEHLGIPLDLRPEQATPEVIDRIIGRCKVTSDADMRAMLDHVETLVRGAPQDRPRDLLDWHEVRHMAESGLVRFGSHTRRHTRLLEGLDAELLQDEVAGSRRVLEEKLGQPAPLFCYPNGDCSPAAYAAVKVTYEGAVTTRGGWHDPTQDPYLVHRVGIHEDVARTPTATLARTAQWPGL